MADVARLTRSYQTHTKLTYERAGLGTKVSSYVDHKMITNLTVRFLFIRDFMKKQFLTDLQFRVFFLRLELKS